MTRSQGFRCKTRDTHARKFRCHGAPATTMNQRVFKRGDFVCVAIDGSTVKGMPHRYYHSRTGRVFNVNPRAIGVEFKKIVGNRQMLKRLHIRPEHLKTSNCQNDFKARMNAIKLNAIAVKAGKEQKKSFKRIVA